MLIVAWGPWLTGAETLTNQNIKMGSFFAGYNKTGTGHVS